MKLRGNTYIRQLDDNDIEGMRVACRLGREVLDEGAAAVAAGVTTDEIDRIVHEATVDRECYPSPLNYYQFPKSCCTSVNEVICHGIPDTRPLQNGDLCNIDVTVYHRYRKSNKSLSKDFLECFGMYRFSHLMVYCKVILWLL